LADSRHLPRWQTQVHGPCLVLWGHSAVPCTRSTSGGPTGERERTSAPTASGPSRCEQEMHLRRRCCFAKGVCKHCMWLPEDNRQESTHRSIVDTACKSTDFHHTPDCVANSWRDGKTVLLETLRLHLRRRSSAYVLLLEHSSANTQFCSTRSTLGIRTRRCRRRRLPPHQIASLVVSLCWLGGGGGSCGWKADWQEVVVNVAIFRAGTSCRAWATILIRLQMRAR
jgi:hypothetical protein